MNILNNPVIAILAVLVLNMLLHKSKWIDNKLYNSIVIFIALIFSGGALCYGIQTHSFYPILLSMILIYSAIDKYAKRILKSIQNQKT